MQYIKFRLLMSGGHPQLFSTDAMGPILEYSLGIPREINRVCHNALALATIRGDKGIDAVGYQAQAHAQADREEPATVLNSLIETVRATGALGIPGLYVPSDPGGPDESAKQGMLRVAVGRLFATLPGFESLSPIDIALIAQASENDFVGTKCGNMDQISSACGVAGHALLIDCRSLAVKPVPVPDNAAIMIFNSNVTRGLVDSAYNVRREQCETAARHFGLPALRDLDPGPQLFLAEGDDVQRAAWRRHSAAAHQLDL